MNHLNVTLTTEEGANLLRAVDKQELPWQMVSVTATGNSALCLEVWIDGTSTAHELRLDLHKGTWQMRTAVVV